MAFTDKQITCVQCGNSFVFTAGEQEFYQEKGYTNEPKRCRACREDAKRSKGGGGGGMMERSGGSYASGPGNGGMGRGSGRQMYDIICDNCQQPSQVPFQPTPGRKILCRSCFQGTR